MASDHSLPQINRYLRRSMELFPFYAHCFLMIGISFERFVCVCRPHDLSVILSNSRRVIMYACIIALALFFPVFALIDYGIHENNQVLSYINLVRKFAIQDTQRYLRFS